MVPPSSSSQGVVAGAEDVVTAEVVTEKDEGTEGAEKDSIATEEGTEKDSIAVAYVSQLLSQLPPRIKRWWLPNVLSLLDDVCDDQGILPVGSACSCSEVWLIGIKAFMTVWNLESSHSVDEDATKRATYSECCCEIDEPRQKFIIEQHDPQVLVGDVELLSQSQVFNLVTHKPVILPWMALFGLGFSCTSITKQSSIRASNKGCVRNKQGSTGTTFEGVRKVIVKHRPKVSFLENVEELASTYDVDGLETSDLDYVKDVFADNKMTLLDVSMDARRHGSYNQLLRLWMIVYDLPRETIVRLHVEEKFHDILNCLGMEPYPPERFFLTRHEISELLADHLNCDDSVKKHREDPKWQSVHEEFFSEQGFTWPPPSDLDLPRSFSTRQHEMIWASNKLFPAEAPGKWQWFDANHSIERVLHIGEAHLKNPWSDCIPTFTGQSCMVGRLLDEIDGLTFKHLHPVEGFRMKGWDVNDWVVPIGGSSADIEKKTLTNILGNMWSLFHFCPLLVAALGCVNWNECRPASATPESNGSRSSESGTS